MINNLTYREKTLWLNLPTTLALLGYYFLSVATGNLSGEAAIWLYLKGRLWDRCPRNHCSLRLSLDSETRRNKTKGIDPSKLEPTSTAISFSSPALPLPSGRSPSTLSPISADALPEGEHKVAEIVKRFNATATPYITINIILLTLAPRRTR